MSVTGAIGINVPRASMSPAAGLLVRTNAKAKSTGMKSRTFGRAMAASPNSAPVPRACHPPRSPPQTTHLFKARRSSGTSNAGINSSASKATITGERATKPPAHQADARPITRWAREAVSAAPVAPSTD